MKKRLLLFLTAIVFLFMASCSSAPKKTSEINTRKNRAADYMEFGNQYFRQGLYDMALVFFGMAYDENIAADFEPGISRVSSSIGRTFLLLGDFTYAEKYIQKSYDFAKQLGDRDLIALSANNFAELNIYKNLIPEAEKFIVEAVAQASANSNTLAEAYHNLALIEQRKGEPRKALATINRAIEINKKNESYLNLAANYYLAASIFSQENNFTKATEMLFIALDNDRLVENSYGLAKDYKALGIVSLKDSNKEEAYTFFIRSLNIFMVIKNIDEEKSVLEFLIEIATDLGKTSDAENFKEQLGAISE